MLAHKLRRAALSDITIVDDGDATNPTGTNPYTFSSQTSTGPVSILFIFARRIDAPLVVSGVTWGGVSMTILTQATNDPEGQTAAICLIAGAQSGDIVITLDAAADGDEPAITKASLANVSTHTATDTDTETGSGATATLDGLTSPGVGGIRLAALCVNAASTRTWTNATELSDFDIGNNWGSATYDLGDDATSITVDAGFHYAICGASLR